MQQNISTGDCKTNRKAMSVKGLPRLRATALRFKISRNFIKPMSGNNPNCNPQITQFPIIIATSSCTESSIHSIICQTIGIYICGCRKVSFAFLGPRSLNAVGAVKYTWVTWVFPIAIFDECTPLVFRNGKTLIPVIYFFNMELTVISI